MREIKFRAWDKSDQKWLEEDQFYIYPNGVVNAWIGDYSLANDEIILTQFTGLLDKNGKEIYEGDIVKHHKYGIMPAVYWNENGCGWSFYEDNGRTMSLSKLCSPNIEIIGNIYEHPELLKEAP